MQESPILWQFTTQAWLPLAGFFLTLALGVFVWSRKWDSLLHQTFARTLRRLEWQSVPRTDMEECVECPNYAS